MISLEESIEPCESDSIGETTVTRNNSVTHPHNRIPTTDLLEELRRLAEEIGQVPSIRDMTKRGRYSKDTYCSRFGSWRDAVREAGMNPHPASAQKQMSKRDVCEAIQNLADQLGHVPTSMEMAEHGQCSAKTAQNRFGTWNMALRAAGFEPNNESDISANRLIAEIERLATELGRVPSTNDLKREGKFSHRPYFRKFGDWFSALNAAGFEHPGWPSGPDNPRWKDGGEADFYYGSNWRRQRLRVLQRDDYQCQMPGCGITREQHSKEYGKDLNVHHIVPVKFYYRSSDPDFDQMNRLDNLVTLCVEHHRYWEQMSPLKPDIR